MASSPSHTAGGKICTPRNHGRVISSGLGVAVLRYGLICARSEAGWAGASLLAPGKLGNAEPPPLASPALKGIAALATVRKVFCSGSKNEKTNGGRALIPARSGTTTCSNVFVPELLFGSPPS